jgi:hypothetical protein
MDESLPVLDPAALLYLIDQAGETAAQRFFDEYLDRLPCRVSRVAGCLSSSNVEADKEAAASLKVTSAMAGAIRREHYCRDLEDTLAARKVPDAAAVLIRLSRTSRLFLHEVRQCRKSEASCRTRNHGGMPPGPAIPELRVRGYRRHQDTTSLDGTRWKIRGRPDDTWSGNPQKSGL